MATPAYRDRLHRTATATRDLIVHGDADRWEVFTKDNHVQRAAGTSTETGVCPKLGRSSIAFWRDGMD